MKRSLYTLLRRAAALALPLIAASPAMPGTGAALAAGSCTGYVVHFDGQVATGGWGAGAYIVNRDSAFCTTTTDSSNHISAWAMIAGNGSQYEYAQTGYIKRYSLDTTPKFFAEYSDDYGHTGFRTYGTPSLGENDIYYDQYDTSSHTEDMVLNDTYIILQTSFDPNGDWPGPWHPEWLGEVHDAGDEMPGSSSARATFTSVTYEPQQGGGFVTPSGETKVQDQGCQQWYDDSHFEIWHC